MSNKPRLSDWITPESLEILQGWARDGMLDTDIARQMGIGTSTLYRWKNDNKEFREALKRGKDVVDRAVESALLRRALGYETEETRIETDAKGKSRTITVKKQVLPDVTAQIYWLKNRKPELWRDKQETAITAGPDPEMLQEIEDFIYNKGQYQK